MSKNIKIDLMLQLPAGKALPKPPLSTVIGPSGISLKKFCDDFNEWSKDMKGNVNLGIIIYDDLSYSFMNELEYSGYRKNKDKEVFLRLWDKNKDDEKFLRECEEAYISHYCMEQYNILLDMYARSSLPEADKVNNDNIVKFHL
jgi:hypothetical protein